MYFFIKSYGCQMNLYDSQKIEDLLLSAGHLRAETPDQANLLIFNTCSIREKADDKLFSDLGRANLLKQQYSGEDFKIVVAGCVSQSRPQDIIARHPYVDIILGPQDIQNITQKLNEKRDNPEVATSLKSADKFDVFNAIDFLAPRDVSVLLTIQEGCDNFCTYCVVPYTRGREFSRTVAEILREAQMMISCGVKEITLLGQNVNSYHGQYPDDRSCTLAELLYEIANLDGLQRLRYVTSNPKDVDEEIAKAHRDIPILMPFLHLPVQSGSNEILRKMNRRYSREKYLEVISMLREYRPDMAFSSDFIVGFPNETDQDFEDTLDLVKQVGYAQAYSFKYSPRPNTPAATMKNQIPEDVKSARLQALQDLLNSQQDKFNANSVGKKMKVLFTKPGKHEGQFVGRSEYFQAVSVNSDKIGIGDIAEVMITEAVSHSLKGKLHEC